MADIQQPHDKLFRAVFSDASEAASLLRGALPDTVRDSFEWSSLARLDGTFIDQELRGSQSDLLYRVTHVATGQSVSMYILLEHQSTPDRWMRLRLLRYCCRIWEAERRDDANRGELRPIVPVVFYQGARGWHHSREFSDLFPEGARELPWATRFTHELIDQSGVGPEAVVGGVRGRIAQLLMMAAFNRHVDAALRMMARLLTLLRQTGGEVDERRRFYLYLMTTQDLGVIEKLRETLRREGSQEGDEIMGYAQQLLAEGEARGRAEGRTEGRTEGRAEGEAMGRAETRVEVVQGMLRAGLAWDVIETATGLTEAGFQELKTKLAQAGLGGSHTAS